MTQPFHFKQFSVHQDQCAMKIGTDGVLLGAWAGKESNPKNILDVGAGTGVIALQLAQRFPEAYIEAIELDADAFEQCVENFERSTWGDRLFCYHASFAEYVDEVEDRYDLIVSNPPFYDKEYTTGDVSRDQARFSSSLPLNELVEGASKLLSTDGIFAVIIPKSREDELVDSALQVNLHPSNILRVRGNKESRIKRSAIEFSFRKEIPKEEELTLEIERHQYTEDYLNLVKDFYLKM
ncbi:methyltransferase [Gangjinia marincola]|uniref:tRNA1(Val) (adenine(37)-N6)-methyltransferase n=1 Tax=Gangjinia marincola TaxID=578463 RepID=A0ABN1MHK3_9FLAO